MSNRHFEYSKPLGSSSSEIFTLVFRNFVLSDHVTTSHLLRHLV